MHNGVWGALGGRRRGWDHVTGPGTQAYHDQPPALPELALPPRVRGHTPQSQASWDGWSPPALRRPDWLPCFPLTTDIVNKDTKSTLRVLYSLFCKHKLKENADRKPGGSPN